MDLKFINQQYGDFYFCCISTFGRNFRFDWINAAYKEEHRVARYIDVEEFILDIAVLFMRGA